jgi:hypothetical protein
MLSVKIYLLNTVCRRISALTVTRTGSLVIMAAIRARAQSPPRLRSGQQSDTRWAQAESISNGVYCTIGLRKRCQKDKVLHSIFAGLEKQTISMLDLEELLRAFIDDPVNSDVPSNVIIFDNGYWIRRKQIVREGKCRFERRACVGRSDKVYCYFQSSLSPWVINTGLFWRCYDEIISCPRCLARHKRGHIGRADACGLPYANQTMQSD